MIEGSGIGVLIQIFFLLIFIKNCAILGNTAWILHVCHSNRVDTYMYINIGSPDDFETYI